MVDDVSADPAPIRGRWTICENHETHSRGVVKPGERLARNANHEPGVFEITELVSVPDEAAIERAAKVLHELQCADAGRKPWEERPEFHKKVHRDEALAVLRAALETLE